MEDQPKELSGPEVIQDKSGKFWRLGEVLGRGYNGCVYNATLEGRPDLEFAVKMFQSRKFYLCELNIVQNIFSDARVAEYKLAKGLTFLGYPKLYGKGKHRLEDNDGIVRNHYFIVLEKLIPLTTPRKYPMARMCTQLLDVIEYIQSHGWAHCDIRDDNIMTDEDGNFYLIDYGIATPYPPAYDMPWDDTWNLIWELYTASNSTMKEDILAQEDAAFGVLGDAKLWKISSFVGGTDVKIFNIHNSNYVAHAGVSEELISIYKELYSEAPFLYYIDSGIAKSGLPFLITPATRHPIEKEYIPDISLNTFILLVKGLVLGLEHLHNAGYCHNNVCPDNIRYDVTSKQFRLMVSDKLTKLQDTTTPFSFVEAPIYTGLDSHNIGSSPRNDIDSLIWCMLYWAGLDIPWARFKEPEQIHAEKLKFMENPDILLNTCVPDHKSEAMCELIKRIILLNKTTPFSDLVDYNAIKQLLVYIASLRQVHTHACIVSSYDCWCPAILAVKDALILGLPNEENLNAIRALKSFNRW